jgi:Tol biopolymer transport system component
MNETSRRRRFGSTPLDRIIIAAIVASAAILGVGAYGILALGSHANVLPYRIAYASSPNGREGLEDIQVIGLDGKSDAITNTDAGDSTPAWSPDGKRLVFVRKGAVWVNDDGGTRQLSDKGATSFPQFSLDGTEIAYANEISRTPNLGFIWLMSADGANQHPIFTSDDPNAKPPDCFGGYPGGWYPGTGRILYRGSSRDAQIAICSVNADGTDVQTIQISDQTALNFSPALSPDGARIAFTSNRDGKDHIFLMNADGSGAARLFDDAGNDESPAWSPDGAWLAFSSDRDGQSHIYMMHPNGSDLTQVTLGTSRDVSPAWAASAQ